MKGGNPNQLCVRKSKTSLLTTNFGTVPPQRHVYLMKCGALDRRQGAKSDCPGLSYFAAGFCEQGLEIGSIKEADDEKYAE